MAGAHALLSGFTGISTDVSIRRSIGRNQTSRAMLEINAGTPRWAGGPVGVNRDRRRRLRKRPEPEGSQRDGGRRSDKRSATPSVPVYEESGSLDVLHLFAQLFDQDLDFDGGSGRFGVG